MKNHTISFMLDDNEYEQFMEIYREHYLAGKCRNKSDLIRKAVLAFSSDKQDDVKEGEQDDKLARAFDFSALEDI